MIMRNPFRFFVELIQQPIWIPVWVLILMIVNIASVGFWNEALAKVIFVAFMLSSMLMMGLYSRFGFERILGLGHIPWIPLLVWVLMEIPTARATTSSPFEMTTKMSFRCSMRSVMIPNTSLAAVATNTVEMSPTYS